MAAPGLGFSILGNCFTGNQQTAQLSCIPGLIVTIINLSFTFVGTVSAAMIIYSGIKMIMAGGEAKELESGRKTLQFSIVGLVLVLLAILIVNTFAFITGVNCISYGGTSFGFGSCK